MKHCLITALLCLSCVSLGCSESKNTQAITQAKSDTSLQEHTKEFTPRVEEVVPGIHMAIGYGLALPNSDGFDKT